MEQEKKEKLFFDILLKEFHDITNLSIKIDLLKSRSTIEKWDSFFEEIKFFVENGKYRTAFLEFYNFLSKILKLILKINFEMSSEYKYHENLNGSLDKEEEKEGEEFLNKYNPKEKRWELHSNLNDLIRENLEALNKKKPLKKDEKIIYSYENRWENFDFIFKKKQNLYRKKNSTYDAEKEFDLSDNYFVSKSKKPLIYLSLEIWEKKSNMSFVKRVNINFGNIEKIRNNLVHNSKFLFTNSIVFFKYLNELFILLILFLENWDYPKK